MKGLIVITTMEEIWTSSKDAYHNGLIEHSYGHTWRYRLNQSQIKTLCSFDFGLTKKTLKSPDFRYIVVII